MGQFDIEIDDFDDVGTTVDRYDSDDTAWKAFLTVETDGFAPYITGTIPLGFFEFFAKAGYYWYEVDARVVSPLGTAADSDSGSDFTWSTGVVRF